MVTAVAEVCDTQSTMNLLGYESEVSSHKYVYLHVWSAVGYQNTIAHRRHSGRHQIEECVVNSVDSEDDNIDGNGEFETDLQDNGASRKKCTMYVGHNGEVHAISQHELYLNRVENWDMEYTGPDVTSEDGYNQRKWKNRRRGNNRPPLNNSVGSNT